MDRAKHPVVRLNAWLEGDGGLLFGHGRAILLQAVDRHGSLRKAAGELRMSYRGAWGKLRRSEEILGFPLVEKVGGNKSGLQLTAQGRQLMEAYFRWFDALEDMAYRMAREIFPWDVRPFDGNEGDEGE